MSRRKPSLQHRADAAQLALARYRRELTDGDLDRLSWRLDRFADGDRDAINAGDVSAMLAELAVLRDCWREASAALEGTPSGTAAAR